MIVPLEAAKDMVLLCDRVVGAMSRPYEDLLVDVALTGDTVSGVSCFSIRDFGYGAK